MAKLGEQFYTDATGQMSASFPKSKPGRDGGVPCTLRDAGAQEASQPHCRKLHLSMAISWLSLARKYEAIERLFQEPTMKLTLRQEDHAA